MNTEQRSLLLDRKDFSIKDTGLSYRVISNCSEKGLLSHFRASKGRWHRLTFLELVEIYVYKELKDVGFSIQKLKRVKDHFYIDCESRVITGDKSGMFINLNEFNHSILNLLSGEESHLLISSDANSISFPDTLHLTEIVTGKSPLSKELYEIDGHSLIIINLRKILQKIGIVIKSSSEHVSVLLNELLEESESDRTIRITKESGSIGKIKKIRSETSGPVEKNENLNKLVKKPNQKITLYTNNHGNITGANRKEDLK